MYVKWKKERLRDKAKSTVLRAQVVRSYRDPVTTKVRSEFVGYLASIKKSCCDLPVAQERFWREVDAKLSHLALPPGDEQHVRYKLLEKVPRPKDWLAILAPYISFSKNRRG
jgi:hypothetical protein